MAFFKFRQSGQIPPEARARAEEAAASGPPDTVERLRRRARHRLLGAAVLVLVAVIGFPLIFDTQPRPIAVDAPIIIPDRDKVAPLKVPAAPSAGVPAAASLADKEEVVTSAPVSPPAPRPTVAKPPVAAVAPTPQPPPTNSADKDSVGADKPASRKPEKVEKPESKPAESSAEATKPTSADARGQTDDARIKREELAARAKREAEARTKREEAARARALLEGGSDRAAAKEDTKPAPAASRFIVQVGAFADAEKVRQVRQQAERAGVKTYTQVVQTADGPRTRVRVGPYASREEAEKAAGALKKAGLAGAILTP